MASVVPQSSVRVFFACFIQQSMPPNSLLYAATSLYTERKHLLGHGAVSDSLSWQPGRAWTHSEWPTQCIYEYEYDVIIHSLHKRNTRRSI